MSRLDGHTVRRLTDLKTGNVFVIDGHLATSRMKRCRRCGESFEAIRLGQRGAYPRYCDACRAPAPRPGRTSGRPRSGTEYVSRSGYVIASPSAESERCFPTSWKSGRISRSHLVWNRAHPADLVQPGEVVHHKNRKRDDDRLANLQKMSPAEHRLEHRGDTRSHKKAKIKCVECDNSFTGDSAAKYCSKTCESKRRNRAMAERRAAASKHRCANCDSEIHGRAVYCGTKECQRVRNTKKQLRWEAKPETKAHISKYRRAKRAASKA